MKVTIGIPAYKAQAHICDALASIQIQTMREDIEVIIASDLPGEDYEFVKERFPDLKIRILSCKKNTGVGLARQRALDACETSWITFMDADDVLISPLAIEDLYRGAKASEKIIECQGAFYEELMEPQDGIRILVHNEISQPWVFARLYSVPFLKNSGIRFSELRAMEDGEFNWKIRLAIAETEMVINKIDKPIYLWRTGSEHSITRVKMKGSDIPQYTFDLGQLGTVEAAIRAIRFIRSSSDKQILRHFILDIMLGLYFTYEECKARAPMFADTNLWNARRFYHEEFKAVEASLTEEEIAAAFSAKNISRGKSMTGVIPTGTWESFLHTIREHFGGVEELQAIESHMPQEVFDNRARTGVIGT